MTRRALLACLLAVAAALAGCELGPGEEREGAGVDLRVTRDFGRELLAEEDELRILEGDTVMRMLQRNVEVETRFGGGFVQAIDGLAGEGPGGTSDWFFYVNGIEADEGAADFELTPGDVVQWDYRDWGATMDVRAIVGAYPQPFLDGLRGKRFPVRVECEDAESQACGEVKRRLREAGVAASGAALGASGDQNVARVLVGRWERLSQLPTARVVELGPERSGVFARFADGGDALELLGEDGRVLRTEREGAGLVAALRPTDDELAWLVTGVDGRGVEAAARALDERRLRDAFAVALVGGDVERLPIVGER